MRGNQSYLAYAFIMRTDSLPTLPPKIDLKDQEKFNRLGWTDGRCFTAYGLRFGLRFNDPTVLELAAPRLPLGWQPVPEGNTASKADTEVDFLYSLYFSGPAKRNAGAPELDERTSPAPEGDVEGASPELVEGYHLLFCGSTLLSRTQELPQLLATLEQHSEQLTAYRAKDYLFVHAGVVAWQGCPILIPGRSMSGKTTLVRALLDAGATYYSDEFAVLDGEGRVHSYPLPISIREGDNIVGCKIPLETLGIQPGTEPLPVALVVVTKYTRYARWRPKVLTPSEAMLALMDNTVAARREPTFTMPILKKVVMAAKTITSKRGDAKRVVPAILQQLNY